ncbi:MAG: hypothetical protein DI605_10910 [Sphingomonas sp.]|nr:MAG: hypothetical protein DI605_10910 [Sphingomonas sp.]
MVMDINAGLERAIDAFEDGWASAAKKGDNCPPSHVEPSLHEYWRDGFHAALANRGSIGTPSHA